MTENDFMRIAIELAQKGCGHVNPNPLVGAVIIKNNKINCAFNNYEKTIYRNQQK